MRALFDNNRKGVGGESGDQSQASSAMGTLSEMNGKTPMETSGSGLTSEKAGVRSTASSTPPDMRNTPYWTPSPYSQELDVVDRGVISMEQAEVLYRVYNTHLVHHYPAVVFRSDLCAEDLRRTKPALFLAVIAAAAGKVDPHLYSILNSEVLITYAHRTVINHEKSLELIQAMIVTCVWYFPPGKFSQLKFYEYIHMAVTMAMDLGLGTNPRTSRSRRGGENDQSCQPAILDEGDIERRRTFLVCYMISTG
jgi:hypothetical protein